MDYGNADKPWIWQGGDYSTEKDPNLNCSSNGTRQNDLPHIVDETTPVKACGDWAYHASFSVSENRNKEVEACTETSSQRKRRRMLQFDTQAVDPSTSRAGLSPEFLESNKRDDPEISQRDPGRSGFLDNVSSLDKSKEGRISECFNNSTTQFDYNDLNFSGASDFHFDLTEVCDVSSGHEAKIIPQIATRRPRKIVFKENVTYIPIPAKLASSVVAYPFGIIKPCEVHGEVTLKDINRRICTPALAKSKTGTASYPISAFSGKPVVVKKKIHTEGGRGSITILRTKG